MTSTPSDKVQTNIVEVEDITMPSLGADMQEGTLTEWLVKEGDQVKSGDIIAVLETQKGAIDMEVYSSGTIAEILVTPVVEVPVGTVLARLTLAEPKEQNSDQTTILAPIPAVISDVTTSESPVVIKKSSDVKLSPIVRRLAKDQQLDLTGIKGSGPEGAILLNDITALVEEKSETKTSSSNRPANKAEQNMRKAIATAMAKSKQEIPHFYLSLTLDITKTQQWLQQHNHATPPEKHVILLAILLKALSKALVKYPKLNGFYQNGLSLKGLAQENNFTQASAIHIGNVISLRQGGLVVPAIHNVDKLSIIELMQALQDITERSRNGHLRSSELMDATFTVTNMGERGADSVFGIIYPPQVAILGFGKVRKELQLINHKVKEKEVLTACLSADHRVIDGMLAAKFLNYLAKKLQKPERL